MSRDGSADALIGQPDASATPLRVLLVEDSEDDADLIIAELRRGGYAPSTHRVDESSAMAAALAEHPWDLVICDYSMPHFSAPAALRLLQESGLDLPFIVVSGNLGEDLAVQAMKAGAHDYLMKDKLARLVPAVARELREAAIRGERQRADEERMRTEQLFRALIENATDLIAIVNADGVVRYASPSHERVLGYASSDLVGRSTFDFVHADDLKRMRAAFRGAARPETVAALEFRFRHRDGSWRRLEGIGKNLLHNPVVGGVVVNTRDITERVLAESERQQEARISSALARVSEELISSLDTPSLLERLCRLTTEVLECDVSRTWLWQPADDVYVPVSGYGDPPEEREATRVLRVPRAAAAELLPALEQRGVVQVQMKQFPHLDIPALAQHLDITVVLYMALRQGSELIGFQTAAFRHREQRFGAAQERLAAGVAHIASLALANARLVEELERANRLKSDFVATMSHELRTPLNVIIGYDTLLLDGEYGPLTLEQEETLRKVDKRSQELLDLINATLDMSRLENGRLPIEISEVRLAALLREIENETRAVLKPEVTLMWQPVPDGMLIRTDQIKLKVVLKNLVANAMKFTPRGCITVAAQTRDQGVEIAVSDTGIGIAAEDLPIIFEPFRQADSSSTRRYGGVGLGLYIARRLLEVLGGTIAVESEIDRGSTFRVWLPMRMPEPQPQA
ncbi:MAG TPA: ATP-binding protein [Candidatus Kryptonia bacterium]|nr:ATP-binding protein [Candidatus Kryptonia bacterium]